METHEQYGFPQTDISANSQSRQNSSRPKFDRDRKQGEGEDREQPQLTLLPSDSVEQQKAAT